MANRFWVGNGGSWSDTAHWSTTSGGSGGASLPGAGDAVIFDTNSFSTTGQVVTISTNTEAQTFTSTATNSPTLTLGSTLRLYGSGDFTGFQFSTVPDLTGLDTPRLQFSHSSGTANLTTGGATIPHLQIQPGETGTTFKLLDNCTIQTNGWLILFSLYNFTFSTNGKTLNAETIVSYIGTTMTTDGGTINVSSNLTLPADQSIAATGLNIVLASGATTTLNGTSGGATLTLSGSSSSDRLTMTNNSGSTQTISNATLANTVLNGTSPWKIVDVDDGGGNDWGGGGGGPSTPARLYHVEVPPDHIGLP